MFISELFKSDNRKVLVIYPGRFQIFHKGHAAVYNHLSQQYGADSVFICTSNKVEPPKSPFSFDDKKKMMELTGVPSNHIVYDAQPYQAKEFVAKFDPINTILLFAVSKKDMAEDPRFQFKPKKDGSSSYFQPLQSLNKCESLDKHAYITTVPTFNFTVLDKPANSATQIRAQFASADEKTQKEIVKDLFGKFDSTVYQIMKTKLEPITENEKNQPKKVQDAMRSRLDQGQGYWDSYYKAKKEQGKKSITEDAEADNQIYKIQQKYNILWQEAAEMYYVENVRVEDEPKELPKKIEETIIHSTKYKNFLIDVDDHYLERAKQRNIGHAESGRAITKFLNIEEQLQEIEPGQQFWVFDVKQDIGLGMRKGANKGNFMHLFLKTVVRGSPPEQGKTPIIKL